MSVQVQLRRGTTANIAGFTPAQGEVIVDTTKNTVVVGDGATAGGWPLARLSEQFTLVGVGTAPDPLNPLSVCGSSALFNGTNFNLSLNKAAVGDTASLIFEDGLSGRAQFGLVGDDSFHVKVAPDGSTWKEAININPADGMLATPNGRKYATTGGAIGEFLLTSGGDGVVSIYRDTYVNHGATPRTTLCAGVSGTSLAVTTGTAPNVFDALMGGVSMIRIWNTTKTLSTWVVSQIDTSHLQVRSASDIATWSVGDTIQVGDPISVTPNNVIAIDISPMMQTVLGAVFPQKGVIGKVVIQASLTPTTGVSAGAFTMSGTGASGSFLGINLPSDGASSSGLALVPTTVLSPVSNSNLVFVRETCAVANSITQSLASIIAIIG